jgi:exoribonuclease II
LIIHDEGRRDNSLTISQDGNIVKILFSRYSDLLEISKAKLRDTIVQHFLKHVGDFKAYESNIPARLNSLKEFSEFASEFRAYRAEEMKGEEENVEDLGLHE